MRGARRPASRCRRQQSRARQPACVCLRERTLSPSRRHTHDIVARIGATAPSTVREAFDQVRQARPGTDLTVRVRRGDKEQDISVRVRVVPFILLDD